MAATLLVEALRRLESLPLAELLSRWPKNPGLTFSWQAGNSALQVAILFSGMVRGAVLHGGLKALGGIRLQHFEYELFLPAPNGAWAQAWRNKATEGLYMDIGELQFQVTPNPFFARWRNETIELLKGGLIEPLPAWSKHEIKRDSAALLHRIKGEWDVVQSGNPSQFVLRGLQPAIWKALDHCALKKQALADRVCAGDGSRLYKPNGIREMRAAGLIDLVRGVGFYRIDAPPSNLFVYKGTHH